jgi:LytS/YehU family sensor histidine kinase
MILQPIVENSIKYAVEKSSAGSTILIKARKDSGKLVLTVRDKVKEMVRETIIYKGIGLNNTEERLAKLYTNQHQLDIKPYQENGFNGLNVTIQIPLHYA